MESIKNERPVQPSRLRTTGSEIVLWLRILTSAAVYATVIVTFGFQMARVEGRSMEPTLRDQDRLVINKLAYHLHAPRLGDVVMLRHPNRPEDTLVKRVVAGPGDAVAFRNGVMLRNGEVSTELSVPTGLRSTESRPATIVPDGFYFVLGDHRINSADSRVFGPVPSRYILGRVELRWWPLADVRSFDP